MKSRLFLDVQSEAECAHKTRPMENTHTTHVLYTHVKNREKRTAAQKRRQVEHRQHGRVWTGKEGEKGRGRQVGERRKRLLSKGDSGSGHGYYACGCACMCVHVYVCVCARARVPVHEINVPRDFESRLLPYPEEVRAMCRMWVTAKRAKDFATSDEVRLRQRALSRSLRSIGRGVRNVHEARKRLSYLG